MNAPARQALSDALNGDADSIDSAVRRGLTALASHMDSTANELSEHFHRIDETTAIALKTIAEKLIETKEELKWVRNLLVSVVVTLLLGVISTGIGFLLS